MTAPLPPHPVLHRHYATQHDRASFVRSLFDQTAAHYDRVNEIFFFGTGAWYRRHALAVAGLQPGMRMLDVAVGTGWVAGAAQRLMGTGDGIIGLDVSEGMLCTARHRLDIPLIQAAAEALPLPDACVDFVTMGYALRHVSDLAVVFREFHRVLRPGGRLLMLEIGRPSRSIPLACAKFYFKRLLPAICRLVLPRTSLAALIDYYWDTIESCVSPAIILGQLTESGFAGPACRTDLGLFQAYQARRPNQS